MAISGIYKITNIINNKIYIGSACNYNARKASHLFELRNNKHGNNRLQNSFNKYGEDSFKFELLEKCNKNDLIKIEQYYINLFEPFFNICKIAASCFGIKRSTDFIEKQKKLKNRKGKKLNEEQSKAIGVLRKQYYVNNPEKKEKLRLYALGNTYRKGVTLSIETRKKISDSKKINAKITDEQVKEIRSLFIPYSRDFSARKLAEKYNVSHQQISRIVNFKDRIL